MLYAGNNYSAYRDWQGTRLFCIITDQMSTILGVPVAAGVLDRIEPLELCRSVAERREVGSVTSLGAALQR